jgi:hypothetical protein
LICAYRDLAELEKTIMTSLVGRPSVAGDQSERNEHAIVLVVVGGIATAATVVFMFIAQFGGWIAATGVGGLIVLVGISIGGFLGFLFSVPRILSKDSPQPVPPVAAGNGSTATAAPSAAVAAIRRERLLSSNTNLERISEWLTTMLVGVGLTQIGSIDLAFGQFSDFLESKAQVFTVDGQPDAGVLPAIGPFLLVCGLVSGFIFFYLYTRIYLSPLFQRVEEILFSDELGMERLDTAVPEFQDAAASLAVDSDNLCMAYTSAAHEISIDDSLNVIQNLLYETGSYNRAITLGNKLVTTSAVKIARYWFLMAAAYGQKHHALKAGGASEKEILLARRAVLDAARKAVRLNSLFRTKLNDLTDANSYDNDLQDFAGDPDFLQIVK